MVPLYGIPLFRLSNGILIKEIGQIARGSVLAARQRVIRLFPPMETAE